MSRNDKIQLIKKHFGGYGYTNDQTIESCLKLLKDYDKQKKDHRIKLLSQIK